MRTLGTLAAILLSLLLSTATRSATINVISPRRGSTVTTISANDDVQEQTPETLVAQSFVKINNDLFSLKDSENVVRKQNNARTSLDQQVDQSEIMLIRDLGNIDETLSIMEYEPQKINRKEKRKISAPHKNADIIEFSSENKEQVPTVISNTYYDPPPTAKPKKNPISSIYYSNPSQESPIQYSDPRSNPRDPEPVYPVSPRSAKPRSKVRPINSQILSSPEAPKPENVSPPVTYSSSPSDSTKHKHVDQTSSPVQFTKSIRKKKIRKRLREKAVNLENNHNSTDDRPKPRGSKRPGSFSLASAAQGSSFQKSNAENVEPTGGSVNRNRETARNNDQERSRRVPDHIRGSSSRKLHEKHTKSHPIGQKVDVPPTNNEMISSHASYRDSPSEIESVLEESNPGVEGSPSSLKTHGNVRDANVYQNAGTTSSFDSYGSDKGPVRQKVASFQNYKEGESTTALSSTHGDVRGSKARISTPSNDYANDRNAYRNGGTSSYMNEEPVTTSSSYYDHDSVTLTSLNHEHDPVNPHNLRTYDDVNAPGTSSNQKLASRISRVHQNSKTDSEMYVEPTVTPSAIFRTIRPPTVTVYPDGPQESASYPSLGYYASSAPTLSTQDSWTPGTKLKQVKEVELDRGSPDVVAEATNLEDEEESKSNRRVDEDEGKNDYRENSERVYGNGRNGQDERYAEKYDDAEAEGTHGDEKHEGSKGGGNGGGKGEFEEGEGAKHEEGHQEIDDEKGEKGYESWHKEEKANKGHHDKEQHSNHYDEEDAKKKEHKEDGEYHEEHQKGEHGEKDAEFDEKGEHKKGHNTKGEHFVHKKDEFEKRTEFFDEFHEDDESEKDGEFHHEHESSKGGHEKKGHLDKVDHEEHYGKKGKHEKGEHYHKEDGHKQAEGKDDHYEHEDMHGQKKGHEEEKKWAYKKGDDGGDDGGDGGKDHKSDR